jgi:hypothetical protein
MKKKKVDVFKCKDVAKNAIYKKNKKWKKTETRQVV